MRTRLSFASFYNSLGNSPKNTHLLKTGKRSVLGGAVKVLFVCFKCKLSKGSSRTTFSLKESKEPDKSLSNKARPVARVFRRDRCLMCMCACINMQD